MRLAIAYGSQFLNHFAYRTRERGHEQAAETSLRSNQARLLMGVLAYNLVHMLRQFYLLGEEVKRSMEWLIKRLIKVGAKVAYHGRRW